jgi:hypothetical protein
MNASDIIRATIFEDGGATVIARIRGQDGAYITQVSLTSISYTIWDVTDPDLPVSVITTTSVTVSASVFDTLQLDGRWGADGIGYNFRHTLPAASFPTGGQTYRAEYKFTPVSGAVFWVVAEMKARALHTS